MSAAAVLSIEAVSKRFGRRLAVDSVSLEIGAGQSFGFLGPNGAGKTTLIRMLVGLTRPTAGTVRRFGRPLDEDRAASLARVGAIVEEPRFHHHISARQNLRLSAAARGEHAHARVDACLDRCGLLDRADDRVREYSLGMRQRLGLARCLLGDPELLILDLIEQVDLRPCGDRPRGAHRRERLDRRAHRRRRPQPADRRNRPTSRPSSPPARGAPG